MRTARFGRWWTGLLGRESWSPTITVGMPVMIPESYVADLSLRMSLYKRLADLDDRLDQTEVLFRFHEGQDDRAVDLHGIGPHGDQAGDRRAA